MDVRTLSRRFGAVSLVVGPMAIAVGTLFESSSDSVKQTLAWTSEHMAAARTGTVVGLGALFILPAMLYLMRLARRGAPVLAVVGGTVSFAAWSAGLVAVAPLEVVTLHAAQLNDRAAAIMLVTHIGNDPVFGILQGVFVLGHLVGMLVLGIALFRSRSVPRWAAVLVATSPIGHAAGMALSPGVDAAIFGVMALATAACGWQLLRLPDDEWDVRASVRSGDSRGSALSGEAAPA